LTANLREPAFEISFTRAAALSLIAGRPVNSRRIIIAVYVVLLASFGAGTGALLWEAWGEYRQLKQIEAASERRLADAQTRLREQERILERLKTDPVYVEKVVRQRLNYAKPGEVHFRFED
jgi:cell division protein DivIC